MRYDKILLSLLCLVCATGIARAQEFAQPARPVLLQCDSLHPADMITIGENPAWLYEHERVVPLKIFATQQSSSGDFRTPFTPSTGTTYQYFAEGQKQIGADHVVEGSFGLVQEYRGNWMWADTRAYDNGNPFLIADSGTGTTQYHGIVLNGTYSGNWWTNILLGGRICYAVSNAVKLASPKPIAMYRDFSLTLGGVYLIDHWLSVGATFLMSNNKEENDFEADQTTSQAQTVIFKFRGIDSYQRFTKTTENRLNEMQSYGGRVHASVTGANSSGVLYAGFRVRSADITDGGSSPVKQGYWQSEITEGSGVYTVDWAKVNLTTRIDGQFDHQWTQHPLFSVVLQERHRTQGSIGELLRIPMSAADVFCGYTIGYRKQTINDYSGVLSSDIASITHTGILGGGASLGTDAAFQLWCATERTTPTSDRITVPTPSAMYAMIGQFDFAYETASTVTSSVGLTVNVNGGIFGRCSFEGVYHYVNVTTSTLFANAWRSSLEFQFSTQL